MYRGGLSGSADGNVGERPITRERAGYLYPTPLEVEKWLIMTLRHSSHVEYFLGNLGFGARDPQRPHDLTGPGNKYQWDVLRGLALQFRSPEVDFNEHIAPSRELHRKGQYHHIKWNGDNPNPNANPEDMLVGAVDAVCALLENRKYCGGAHSYSRVQDILAKNPAHKVHFINQVIPQMKGLVQPNLELITDLTDFPNIGLPYDIYYSSVSRTREAIMVLGDEPGIELGEIAYS